MDIHARNLGYREIDRMADFLKSTCDCNYEFQELVDTYDSVEIGYDLRRDEIRMYCYDSENHCIRVFYENTYRRKE